MFQCLKTLEAAEKPFLNSKKLFIICSKRKQALQTSGLIDLFWNAEVLIVAVYTIYRVLTMLPVSVS